MISNSVHTAESRSNAVLPRIAREYVFVSEKTSTTCLFREHVNERLNEGQILRTVLKKLLGETPTSRDSDWRHLFTLLTRGPTHVYKV